MNQEVKDAEDGPRKPQVFEGIAGFTVFPTNELIPACTPSLTAVMPLVALKVVKAPDCGVVDPSPAPGAAQLTFRVREPPVPPPVNPVPAVTPVT
jgi:hypothetical protein